MRKLLVSFAYWLLRVCGALPAGELIDAARALCREQEERCAPGTSGEYKRSVVYAALRKRFPQASLRAISRAIEDSLP
ncbi:MAG: hypothetical protein L0Z53_24400 [Acidobacteriales bacterium]|nr:hypothetical protein [Terriglobales bacterium]